MPDGLTVAVVSDQIGAGLRQLQERLGDLQPAFEEIGSALESRVMQRFDTKRDPWGQLWKPLAESTRARYDKVDTVRGRGGNAEVRRQGTLLDRTGQMRQGLSHVADHVSLMLGFDRGYALFHDFGTRKMRRRGLLLGDPEAGTLATPDEELVMTIIGRWLAG